MRLYFGLGVGSTYSGTAGSWAGATYLTATGAASVIGTLNATWYITGVQLEVGSVATEFERRPYGTELQLCYRYCQQFTLPYGAIGKNRTSSLGIVPFQVTTPMRSSPSFTASVNANGGVPFSSFNSFITSGTSDGGFVGGGLLINGSGLSTTNPFFFSDSGTTKIGILSAEL